MRYWPNADIGECTAHVRFFAIFSDGYVSNTLLDEVVDRTETYFHVDKPTYKKDSKGYIICSMEKPKTTSGVRCASEIILNDHH